MGALLDRVHRGVPAPLLFMAGGCSTYLGAALAVGLFEVLSPAVAWLLALLAALMWAGYIVLGKWVAGGLGSLLITQSEQFDTAGMLATTLIITLTGVALMGIGRFIEGRFARWRVSS